MKLNDQFHEKDSLLERKLSKLSSSKSKKCYNIYHHFESKLPTPSSLTVINN